ncbi:hypothetical protein AAFF_G00295280 [Aldrovandia affinis]|uniref:DUF3715 domain-containing protein n=1 Tax=Aldrovandia affinis TaxID=143900 RepID=A0AAD7W0K3_9TELE|nr:hypothetical protein AAFF_G00295280 [Aldrovandia affinis]
MAGISRMEVQMTRGRNGSGGREASAEGCSPVELASRTAERADQDGGEAGREGPETGREETGREAAERRRGGEPLSRSFHIPRKSREQKALFQNLPPESREFEDVVKILLSSYLESSSAGTFSYAKARLVHNELLEKDFCEKRRELKQKGRSDSELLESYSFLLTHSSKFQLPEICEKGLHVGHSQVGMLGNPALGVSLSRFSDLLQINPFEVGASGEIIIFKVMKGKVKNVFENKPKISLDPSPGFDCHVSKKSSLVTSLLSYRAFQITQQYFYEYVFDDLKPRPRHVCPYAVVSFLYRGRQGAPTPHPTAPLRPSSSRSSSSRSSSSVESSGGVSVRSRYAVWSGQLQNKGQVVSQVCLCSSSRAFLPLKLPPVVDVHTAVRLDQLKRDIPPSLFCLNTYSRASEVVKSGLYCSLFEVEEIGRGGLSVVLHTLERDGMVMVKPLADKGFLFLLSSAQMVGPNGRGPDWVLRLQVLFVFQESRGVRRFSCEPVEGSLGSEVMCGLRSFIPALHYAQLKLRSCAPPHLAAGVERQARDYLSRSERGRTRPYYMREYQQSLDHLEQLYPAPRHVHNLEGRLRAYLSRPGTYALPVDRAQNMVDSLASANGGSDNGGSENGQAAGTPDKYPQRSSDTSTAQVKGVQACRPPSPAEVLTGGQDCDLRRRDPSAQNLLTFLLTTLTPASPPDPGDRPDRRNGRRRRVKAFSGDQPREESLLPWRLILITGLRTERFRPPGGLGRLDPRALWLPGDAAPCDGGSRRPLSEGADGKVETVVGGSSCPLDAVVERELRSFSVGMQDVLKGQGVKYLCETTRTRPALNPLALSDYVSQHAPPAAVQSFVSMFHEAVKCVIGSQTAPTPSTAPLTNPAAATAETRPPDSPPPGGGVTDGLTAQTKPEVLGGLAEVMEDTRKNIVRFYIHPGDQDEHPDSHCQIKEYLKSLGKEECDPQTYLQRASDSEKLLVIIENQDIAAHLHKVPALLALKSRSVSFAGVDGPEDLRNHTYNELFVSGGFIVSDEFLLSPDFITCERLQALLTALEGRCSPESVWCWKIHRKTQKKLKDLGRSSAEAQALLSLLCTYQRRRLVEFLPYHKCDGATSHTPDLPCLTHLQSQNTQHRHAIFLTERRVEMFPGYSSNGILVASIDDFLERFDELVGPCESSQLELAPPAETAALRGEGLSLEAGPETVAVPLQKASQPALPHGRPSAPTAPHGGVSAPAPQSGGLCPPARPQRAPPLTGPASPSSKRPATLLGRCRICSPPLTTQPSTPTRASSAPTLHGPPLPGDRDPWHSPTTASRGQRRPSAPPLQPRPTPQPANRN